MASPQHGPVVELTTNLWLVEAPVPQMPINRRMAVIRLSDGRLLVHSAVMLDDATFRRLDNWGTVAFIIIPNSYHQIDGHAFKRRYPNALLICPQSAQAAVSKRGPVDGDYDLLSQHLANETSVQIEPLAGVRTGEAAFIAQSNQTALIVADAIFNQPHLPGFTGFVFKFLGSTGGPKVTQIFKRFGVADAKAYKAHLQRLSQRRFDHLVVAHGDVISHNVSQTLSAVADSL